MLEVVTPDFCVYIVCMSISMLTSMHLPPHKWHGYSRKGYFLFRYRVEKYTRGYREKGEERKDND